MGVAQYDSVTLSAIPGNPPAVAGYVGGFWPNYATLVTLYPKAHHLSIAVNATEDADCLDVENGDAVPSDAPAWFSRQKARGVARPCFYADTSTMPAVLAALSGVGIQRTEFRAWTAHYTNVAHIEPGSDATQWTEAGLGRNLDISDCQPEFFDATVPARNPVHYDWFDGRSHYVNGRLLNERALVEKYDRLRKHGVLNRIRLAPVRADLETLAQRVYTVAHQQPTKTGRPSWGTDHRGWRFQQLTHRAQGQRFV